MSDATRSRYVCPGCGRRDASSPIGAGWELCSPCGRLWTPDTGPVRPLELLALARALTTQPELAARLRRAGDALMTREVATEGVTRIALERARQIAAEGRSPEADLAYGDDVLAAAGACYALPHTDARRQACRLESDGTPIGWPFPADAWKPGAVYQRAVVIGDEHPLHMPRADRLRELEKAGALIAAEIDRLLAMQAQESTTTEGQNHGD